MWFIFFVIAITVYMAYQFYFSAKVEKKKFKIEEEFYKEVEKTQTKCYLDIVLAKEKFLKSDIMLSYINFNYRMASTEIINHHCKASIEYLGMLKKAEDYKTNTFLMYAITMLTNFAFYKDVGNFEFFLGVLILLTLNVFEQALKSKKQYIEVDKKKIHCDNITNEINKKISEILASVECKDIKNLEYLLSK